MQFEWDPQKAESNFRKHRVRFLDAQSVFEDERLLTVFDESADEERYIAIGRGYRGLILLVVYVIRGEKIRLISARKATTGERQEYEKNK